MFKNCLLKLAILAFAVGCSSGYAPGSIPATGTSVVAAGVLKDINTGIQQNVSGKWVLVRSVLYFVNAPASNPGHQIWKSTAAGTASLVVDLGLANLVTGLVADQRTGTNPSRFYFVVNGTQVWTSDGTTTTMIAQTLDSNGPINASALGNDLYYQLNGTGSNGKVLKSVNGATPVEIFSSGVISYNVQVSFQPASTHMYIYDSVSPVTVYSHTGAAAAATTVATLTAGSIPSPIGVVGDDLYYQENGTSKVFKSVAGAAGGEIKDPTGPSSIASAVTLMPGSTHMYLIMTATGSPVYSHSGAAGSALVIDTTAGGDSVTVPAVVGDDLYYQYAVALNVEKSVAGAVVQEVKDNSGSSIAVAVNTIAGSAHMYFFDVGAPALVYSHTGATANATLVATVTAANTVSNPTIVTDDLYYQESATFKVFQSRAGVAAAEDLDDTGASFAAAVQFVPAQTSVMYFHGNGGNESYYSHTGAQGDATLVLNGAVGTFNSAQTIPDGSNLFFQGASTSPIGLFDSVSGAQAVIVGNYTPAGQQDYLCNVANTAAAIGSTLFFVATDGTHGCELWMTSGSAASTAMVADVFTGQASANPTQLTAVGTRIYFVAQDNSVPASPNNTFLYFSDPPYTAAHKVTLPSADTNPLPVFLTAVGTKLYFGATSGGDVTLYEHDSTGSGAAAILATSANLIMNVGTAPFIVALGTKAYIRAAPDNTVYDVYVSDSTASVTTAPTLITHINANPATTSNPQLFKNAVSGSTVFFTADDGTGIELWRTSGTALNTVKIRNINGDKNAGASAAPSQLTMAGTSLFLTAQDNTPGDVPELYVSFFPWTSAQKLTFVNSPTTCAPTCVTNLNALGSNLVFSMSVDGTSANYGVYATDGTVAGTLLIRGPSGAPPNFNTTGNSVMNSRLFYLFQPNTATFGNQLFKTDGTESGTKLVASLNPDRNAGSSFDDVAIADLSNFAIIGGGAKLIFPGNNGTDGVQLWYTDGTSFGTGEISDFTPSDTNGSAPQLLGIANGVAYYVIGDTSTGRALYKVAQ